MKNDYDQITNAQKKYLEQIEKSKCPEFAPDWQYLS